MERRRFMREFKHEAVRLITRRLICARIGRPWVHTSQLRDWVKKLSDDPEHAFPGNGQLKPEQLEISSAKWPS